MAAKIIGLLVLTLSSTTTLAHASTMTSPGFRISGDGISSGGSNNAASPAYDSVGTAIGQVVTAPSGGAGSPNYTTRPLALAASGAATSGIANGVLDPANTSGEPSAADALIAMRAVMGDVALTQSQKSHADVAPLKNGRSAPDGKVDLGDVLLILRRVVKLVSW